MDKLNNIGLHFETAIADQPVVTKKRVVDCLQQIGQQELAGIIKYQGMYVYTTYVYEPKMRHGILWLHAGFYTIILIIAVLLSCIKSLHVASLTLGIPEELYCNLGRISTHGCSTRTFFEVFLL